MKTRNAFMVYLYTVIKRISTMAVEPESKTQPVQKTLDCLATEKIDTEVSKLIIGGGKESF